MIFSWSALLVQKVRVKVAPATTPSSPRWVLRRNEEDVLLGIWAHRPVTLLAVGLQIVKVYLPRTSTCGEVQFSNVHVHPNGLVVSRVYLW